MLPSDLSTGPALTFHRAQYINLDELLPHCFCVYVCVVFVVVVFFLCLIWLPYIIQAGLELTLHFKLISHRI